MSNTGWLTKTLAIAGTVLVWLPITALVLITGIVLIRHGGFHFDYLIPAELFPVFLGGGFIAPLGVHPGETVPDVDRRWIGRGCAFSCGWAGHLSGDGAGIRRDQTWRLAVDCGAWSDHPLRPGGHRSGSGGNLPDSERLPERTQHKDPARESTNQNELMISSCNFRIALVSIFSTWRS